MKTISSHSKTSNPFNITEPVTGKKRNNLHLKSSTKMIFYHILILTQSASFKVREPLSKNTIQPFPKGKITLVNLRNFKIKG